MEQKLKFATVEAVKSPTPKWANYAFRTALILCTAAGIWLSGTRLISELNKPEIYLALQVITAVVNEDEKP